MKSNSLLSNVEKIIFGVLIAISLAVTVIYQGSIYIKGRSVENQAAGLKFKSPPEKIEGIKEYEDMVARLNQSDSFDKYEPYLARNGFLKYIVPPPQIPPFELKSVCKTYLDAEYKGFIESLSGTVGQLKIGSRSYFVKKGNEVESYTIKGVRNDYILVENNEGAEYKLPLGEKILSDNYEAALYVTKTHETVKVKLGDVVDGFKVLDISPDYVVLFNQVYNQKLIVEK